MLGICSMSCAGLVLKLRSLQFYAFRENARNVPMMRLIARYLNTVFYINRITSRFDCDIQYHTSARYGTLCKVFK